jgi:hypothetical protein
MAANRVRKSIESVRSKPLPRFSVFPFSNAYELLPVVAVAIPTMRREPYASSSSDSVPSAILPDELVVFKIGFRAVALVPSARRALPRRNRRAADH